MRHPLIVESDCIGTRPSDDQMTDESNVTIRVPVDLRRNRALRPECDCG